MNAITLPPRRQDSMKSLRYNTQVISIVSTFVRGVKSLRIESKKRASEPCKNSLALQSLKDYVMVISIISLYLGFVQLSGLVKKALSDYLYRRKEA